MICTEDFTTDTYKDPTTDSYSEDHYVNVVAMFNTSKIKIGQSFTGNGKTLVTCNFYMRKLGSPTGNAVAKLYSHTGTFGTSSLPDTLLATSDNFDVSTLTTSLGLQTFTFPTPYILVNTTKYVIVLEYSGSSEGDEVYVGYGGTDHSGNACSYTSSWVNFGADFIFYINKATTADWSTTQGKLLLNKDIPSSVLIDSNNVFNADWAIGNGSLGRSKIAQSFINVTSIVLSSVKLNLWATGVITGNAVVKIYAHSGTYGTSSLPTGAALATSDNFDVSTISGYTQLETFTFSGANKITLNASTYYVLSLEYSGGDASRYVLVKVKNTNVHSGNLSRYISSWSAFATYDCSFYIYGDGYSYDTANNIGQSLKLNSGTDIIYSANLAITSTPDGATITTQLSADGGVHWQTFTPATQTKFTYPGNDLRFKIIFTATAVQNPFVDDLTITTYGSKVTDSFIM